MTPTIEKNEKYVIVKILDKVFNEAVSVEVKPLFISLINDGVRNIILDLSKVVYCDSSGINTLLSVHKMCNNANGSFVLTGFNEEVRKIISLCKLDTVLLICPTVEEAIDLVFMEEMERDLTNDSNND